MDNNMLTLNLTPRPQLFAAPAQLVIDQNDPLIKLGREIDWLNLCEQIGKFYNNSIGRPSTDLRLLISVVMLQIIYKLSDEQVITAWSQNICFQHFSGICYFAHKRPFDPSTLTRFRARIKQDGFNIIFAETVRIHGPESLESTVIIDSTVMKKYTSFPTDTKLRLDVITKCIQIANHLEIKLDNTYTEEVASNKKTINFTKSTKSVKAKEKKSQCINRIKDIANILLDELEAKAHPETLKDDNFLQTMKNYRKAVNQAKDDKNKIYSIFEPHIACIAKGKTHVKYEFGSKVGFVTGLKKGIILGAVNFNGCPFDGDTILPSLIMSHESLGTSFINEVIGDLGYRGRDEVLGASVITPDNFRKESDLDTKEDIAYKLRRRSSIEPIIGHMKNHFCLGRNMLHGIEGDHINVVSAAIGFNLRKFINLPADGAEKNVGITCRHRRPKRKTRGVPFVKPELIIVVPKADIFRCMA
jgi:IS5 family transposase